MPTKSDAVDKYEDAWDDKAKDAPVELRQVGTITLKAGGNDSWIVFHPTSIAHARELLEDEDLSDLMELTAQREAEFVRHMKAAKGVTGPAKSSGGSGWSKSKPAAKKSYGDPEYDDDYDCAHGEREWVDKGTWRAWMCSETDKSEKCEPLWANPDGSIQKKRR